MNEHVPDRELPELSNDQIEILHDICYLASSAKELPFNALRQKYYEVLRREGLDPSNDNAVIWWYMRVGERARRHYRAGTSTNFVPYVRNLLEENGVTVIDDDDAAGIGNVTRSLEDVGSEKKKEKPGPKRRVSFDDAHLEETWLSERSRLADISPQRPENPHLKQRPHPRGARDYANGKRARSTSSQRPVSGRHPAPKHYQDESPSTDYTSEYEEPRNATLLFEPSHTQLEQNAEAFLATSDLRYARNFLHHWHDQALALRIQRQQALAYAAAQDRRKLLKESFDIWHSTLEQKQEERDRILHLESIASGLRQKMDRALIGRAFSHWDESTKSQGRFSLFASHNLLAKKYFRRWHTIAAENAIKASSILCRKYLALWRDRTARRAIEYERADAHYEEVLMRKYCRRWLRNFRSRMAEAWHEQQVLQSTFGSWVSRLGRQYHMDRQAEDLRQTYLARSAFRKLSQRHAHCIQAVQSAGSHYNSKLASTCLRTLEIHAKLTPLATQLSTRVQLNLKRKSVKAWQLNLTLTRQAADVDRKRTLQSAWTSWNDALRCRALAQRIDERVLVESLYKWMLQARLRYFQRSQAEKALRRALTTWNGRVQDSQSKLEQASARYAEGRQWRRMKFGMLRLNSSLRNHEDAERAAVEFSNSRALPDVLDVWKHQTEHARKLAKWAADARFYVLCTRTLKLWSERTVEHKHNKRREAYAQVRARVKIRIVRDCFTRWRTKGMEVYSMQGEAERRDQARLFKVGTEAFDTWREKTAQYAELELQARAADHQKLLTSAMSALVNQHADLSAMEQQAVLFKQESDLALLASALKRVQWETFTATRRVESADALQARNRDQHIKQMLRHWSSQAASRKTAKIGAAGRSEPESPSLRPASRAASRSRERPAFTSSPPVQSATPGYMRTPSRSRRAGRFKPLPTPAHVTPMAFDRSYFVTTPAPLSQARPADAPEETSDVFEGLTPQITPFARKLRAGGVTPAPPSALRSSILGRSVAGGTSKSVRFAGSSRFASGRRKLDATDEEAELNS